MKARRIRTKIILPRKTFQAARAKAVQQGPNLDALDCPMHTPETIRPLIGLIRHSLNIPVNKIREFFDSEFPGFGGFRLCHSALLV